MATKLVKGNTAVVIGALYAGSDCFFGYPITPASEVLHEASRYYPQMGRQFVQAESEEASINMCYGAASAGHRVFTASSGPGISLMQEGISYLAGAELPTVIVDIMRAGPGLGNIGPEQSDYNQVVKGGGHGNYKCIVLAPNCVQEMCDMTMLGFELAEKWRTPAYVLADGVLGQMIEPFTFPEKAVTPKGDNSWAVCGTAETRKNLISSIFLDFTQLEEFNTRLQDKYARIEAEEARCEEQQTEDADIILVAYGISSRIAKTAMDVARKTGLKVGLFRPKTLFPFPKAALQRLASKPVTFVSVEMSNGQLLDDIRLAISCQRPVELVNRLGGNLITLDQVMDKINHIAGK
ncbi:3-methyl-2-oxobutanoate dehydrogenase subunit VorB [Oligosphaera ethanolica]|uniref:2-oxoisovalerate ferredoxin oxidoreductase alpha subunit n=1 Tax=Oligosphaera ethanolica TaxID=760260 RepID=A0AAE3VCM9_9BACT|nr:3-methyl-2-oxobutanoate dehydrogenase subunit VorB [Oligosphaera ethanolica]MDQ0288059.1 2-oxoisovalerate ferredoxin oxidoreductase alpha subunit [Oligosphaera ethanolica]